MELNLDNIVEPTTEPTKADLERSEIEETKTFGHVEDRFIKDTVLRIQVAKYFSIVIALWLLAVILILVGNNFNYRLSDSVLITLLTTTTIQVLGMMVIILWDLFPGGNGKKNPNMVSEKLKKNTPIAKRKTKIKK